jgi:hypothetical protein
MILKVKLFGVFVDDYVDGENNRDHKKKDWGELLDDK